MFYKPEVYLNQRAYIYLSSLLDHPVAAHLIVETWKKPSFGKFNQIMHSACGENKIIFKSISRNGVK